MTSIVPLILLAGAPAQLPDIAFTARFYYQGKRKSNYQVYVAKFDGTQRRQITFGNVDIGEAVWVDSKNLVYTVTLHERLVKDTYVTDTAVRVINIQTGKDRKLAEYKSTSVSMVGNRLGVTYEGKTTWFEPTATSMKPLPNFQEPPYEDFGFIKTAADETENLAPRRYTLSTKTGSQIFNWKFEFDRMEYLPGEVVTVSGERSGQPFEFNVLGHDVKDIQRDEAATYLVTGPAFSKFEYPTFVYRWADEAPQPKLIASKVGNIQFKANQDYWFGDDIEQRRLMALKDGRMVYVNSLYCGNWKTGKRWTVATGLVSVYGASVRPKA